MDVNYLPIGFIGSGNMGCGIISGLISLDVIKSSNIVASKSRYIDSLKLKDKGVLIESSNKEVAKKCKTLVLSVKPPLISKVLEEINGINSPQLIISVAAGISIKQLNQWTSCPVIRVMPNTAVSIGEGCCAFTGGSKVTKEQIQVCKSIFSSVCKVCEEVSEPNIDAMIGISGSGIAYMYIVVEALTDAGVKMGLTRDSAKKLASQTMVGAGKMVQVTGLHPMMLKDQVTSPGGTTICGVTKLEELGLRNALIKAAEAARDRASHLS